MKILGGKTEGGIVVGNAYDKYNSSNPIVRLIMDGFKKSIDELVNKVSPSSIYEIGCGEGYWTLRWIAMTDGPRTDESTHLDTPISLFQKTLVHIV